ncbi:hypothetical protein H4582DRAFT_1090902 [Lactarius indigo]|nr:hypothetical protein H4582DRAFT_1090902 [Lactarius indigo]
MTIEGKVQSRFILSTLTQEGYMVNSLSRCTRPPPTVPPAAAPNTVTMTLPDVQTPALINSSTILLSRSLASDLHALQLAHPRCIGTAILFHYRRSRPLKPGLVWLTCKWPRPSVRSRARKKCIDLLQANIKNSHISYSSALVRQNGTCTAVVNHDNPVPGMVPEGDNNARLPRVCIWTTERIGGCPPVTPKAAQRRRRQKARRRCRTATPTACSQP